MAIPSKDLPFWLVTKKQDQLFLYMQVEWKFLNLRTAFAEVVGTPSRTLVVYSDVVHCNVVGDTEHPLVREVLYNVTDRDRRTLPLPLHMQWMPCVVHTGTSSKSNWSRITEPWCNSGPARPSSHFSSDDEGHNKGQREKSVSHTMCMVLLSDTSKEFPKNTSSAFKV